LVSEIYWLSLLSGAPFLLYLYYRFDNRPAWFRALYKVSNFDQRRARPYISDLDAFNARTLVSEIYRLMNKTT
jgi:hypothetical protein